MIRVYPFAAAFTLTFALSFVACKDEPPPPPSPSDIAAQASARAMAKAMLEATPPPQHTATATATANANGPIAPLLAVGGFSKDGKTFGYLDRSAFSNDLYLKKASVGVDWPTQETLDDVDAGRGALGKAGFSAPRPVPDDLRFTPDLTAKTPSITLARGAQTRKLALGDAPFPPDDRAELLGVSADGKYVAIHIAGPDVPGLLSKGGGGIVHFVFVAPVP